jgi:hypothetical protein
MDFVGDRGPRGFLSLGDGLAEVGVRFGVGGDLGIGVTALGIPGVGVDFGVKEEIGFFGVVGFEDDATTFGIEGILVVIAGGDLSEVDTIFWSIGSSFLVSSGAEF